MNWEIFAVKILNRLNSNWSESEKWQIKKKNKEKICLIKKKNNI
jgi:hypothetical protein